MNSTIETALQELNATLDQCFDAWTEATRSGDPAPVAAYASEQFNGTSGYPGADRAEFYDRAEAMDGLPRLFGYVKGATHTVHNRYLRMRNAEEGVVSFEQCFEREGKVLLRFLYLQTWRKIEGRWLLVREALEQLAC